MGHNASRNPFRRAQLGLDDPSVMEAVDAYKSRSVWASWWKLEDAVRRRYFTREERAFITRYGARLDELACFRVEPRTDRERQFLRVCCGEEEPSTPNHRTWLLVQLVCRYHRAVARAAGIELAEHDVVALRGENEALKAKVDHLERYLASFPSDVELDDVQRPDGRANVAWATPMFLGGEGVVGPAPRRFIFAPHAWPSPAQLIPTTHAPFPHQR